MPLVPAAGYPYQPFPSERAPLGPPSNYQNIPSSPLDFGAQVGAATERLGAAGQQVSSEISQRAIERQSLYNQIAADSAQTQYMKESHRVLFGDPETGDTGFYGKHGEEAMRAAPAVGKQLNEISERIGGGLANARQRLEFNEYTRRLRMFTDRDVLTHYEKEMSFYGEKTHEAQATTAMQAAGNKYNDEAYIQHQLDIGTAAKVKLWQDKGFAPGSDQTKAEVSKYHDEFAQEVVNGFLAQNNPAGAENWIKTHQGLVTNPLIAERINREVHTKAVDANATRIVFGLSGDNAYAQKTRELEGLGKDPRSTAVGGFVEGTWLDLMHGEPEAAGKDKDSILSLRGDPIINTRMINKYADQNATVLQSNGVPVNDATLRLAHYLGPDGATKTLQAAPATPMKQLVSAAAIAANPGLGGKTAGDMRTESEQRMGTARSGAPTEQNLEDTLSKAKAAAGDDPELFHKLITKIEDKYRIENMDRLAHEHNVVEANDKAAMGFVKDIHQGKTDGIIERIDADPNLKWQTKQHLADMALTFTRKAADPQEKTYGPGFHAAYDGIFAPEGSSNRITDPNQIYARARSDGDLTVPGAEKLVQLMESRKTPAGNAWAESEKQFFKNARFQITGESQARAMGLTDRDPKGEELLLKWTPQAFEDIAKAKAEGLTAAQTFNPESPTYIGKSIEGIKRPMAEWLRDIVPPPVAQSYKTLPDLQKAVAAGKISREDAMREAVKNGWNK